MTRAHTVNDKLAVYGFGATGSLVVDQLLDAGCRIDCIIDRDRHGEVHRNIRILRLEDFNPESPGEWTCLVALHNHYLDLSAIAAELKKKQLRAVVGLVKLRHWLAQPRLANGYWLDFTFDYAAREADARRVEALLTDDVSRRLLRQIIDYRAQGDLSACPSPSLHDEYTPDDLPRFKGPLRLIDCGAFTGVAIEKFQRQGYAVQSLMAFEPDPANFARLVSKHRTLASALFLPLATWSSNTTLRFSGEKAMGSALDPNGASVIQCVKVDDIAPDFDCNLIKLDVEGAETETLLGLEATIRRQRPNLCVSVYHRPQDLFEIPQLLDAWGLGYSFHLRVHEHSTFGVVLYCLQTDRLDAAA